jgi:hypothetical protein
MMIGRMYGQPVRQFVLYFGSDEMRMRNRLDLGEIQVAFRLIDIREMDTDMLLNSGRPGDLALALLARGGVEKLRSILEMTKSLSGPDRDRALMRLAFLAGLRGVSNQLRLEMAGMNSTYIDFEENAVLQMWKEQIQSASTAKILRRQLAAKFGALPNWAEDRLKASTLPELETSVLRVLTANSIEEVLGSE